VCKMKSIVLKYFILFMYGKRTRYKELKIIKGDSTIL